MKPQLGRIRFALRAAMFSLLILSTLFLQFDASAQIASPLDCAFVEGSGENNPSADPQDMDGLFAPLFSLETPLVEVTRAARLFHLYSQTPPYCQSRFILRC